MAERIKMNIYVSSTSLKLELDLEFSMSLKHAAQSFPSAP